MLSNKTLRSPIFSNLLISFIGFILLHGVSWAAPPQWKFLDEDGLHDPTNPALYQKQDPEEALETLPFDFSGNKVNWVRAIEDGDINPRASLSDSNKVQPVLDMDVILDATADMPMVRFPHKPHTEWLDCSNCHDWLFKQKAKATNFGMFDILTGEFCGRCHGGVAFPLTNCFRCHSVYRTTADGSPPKSVVEAQERGSFEGYGH